jgi:hypothetical protein
MSGNAPGKRGWTNLLKPKVTVNIAADDLVGFYNVLDLVVSEEVERIDVLFDKAFDFQEGRNQVPFVLLLCQQLSMAEDPQPQSHLLGVDRICQAFTTIKRFQESFEALQHKSVHASNIYLRHCTSSTLLVSTSAL